MSLQNADGVKETTTTTGAGTISLGGAATGLRTFVAGVGNGATCPYRIDDGLGNWEETWGTVASGTPDTITRGTLINSSTTTRITFGAGTKTVAIVPMVELLITPAASVGLVETSIASATTTDLGTVQTFRALITGTTTITGFGTQPNAVRFVRYAAALTLTYNATSLILLGAANRVTVAGAVGLYMSDASGNWRELQYQDQDVSTVAQPTFAKVTSTTGGFVSGSTTFGKGDTSGTGAATNYTQQATSVYRNCFCFATWNSGTGYALFIVDASDNIQTVASSNAVGVNSCYDNTNNVASNGANGIGIFITAGSLTIQTKTSYSGGAVRLHRFGG